MIARPREEQKQTLAVPVLGAGVQETSRLTGARPCASWASRGAGRAEAAHLHLGTNPSTFDIAVLVTTSVRTVLQLRSDQPGLESVRRTHVQEAGTLPTVRPGPGAALGTSQPCSALSRRGPARAGVKPPRW